VERKARFATENSGAFTLDPDELIVSGVYRHTSQYIEDDRRAINLWGVWATWQGGDGMQRTSIYLGGPVTTPQTAAEENKPMAASVVG
jgi:hypothetical protein